RAIMGLCTETLLTDLPAAEVAAALADRERPVEPDTVEARCRQLVAWGNLVPSLRDARVSTVADYLRSRSRYQVSKLGGRVHRDAVEVLHAADGAREVARELLGQIVGSLDGVLRSIDATCRHADPSRQSAAGASRFSAASRPADADALAGEVTSIFNNQRLFTASVRDFYAYLSGVLSRYDLG